MLPIKSKELTKLLARGELVKDGGVTVIGWGDTMNQ